MPKHGNQPKIRGTFRRTSAGVGFVRPERMPGDESPPLDVFIAAADTADAANGDVVLVEITSGREGRRARPDDRGPKGRVVKVVERQTHSFVGTYFESRGSAFVRTDGGLFERPIYVGDPGAKSANDGDKVVFEMVRFPSYLRDGEGVIVEVLGPHGKPGVDTRCILREFDLPEQFDADVLEESRAEAERFDETAFPHRLDLRDETTITIDPIDARDFDDAISLDSLDDGGWRLGVHIADVSHFVRPRSAIDRSAKERATSVYLPDRVIPMLPELISNGLASLQPGKPRLTKTAILEFTPDGLLRHAEFHNSVIRSAQRLTYEEVDVFFETEAPHHRHWPAAVRSLLLRMRELARLLRGRRFARGALELNLTEVKIDLDRHGRVTGAHVCQNTESHQIIEEFMLAANEAVAEMLRDKGLAFLRRVHQAPSPMKLRALAEFVRELRLPVERVRSRGDLQKLLATAADRPERNAVNYAVLRSMQRAVYSPAEEGHYALASDCYCHFTSPIRRYPDLTVHRLMDAVFAGRRPREHVEDLLLLGQHCSDQEQRAESAERESTKLKLLLYLNDQIGLAMPAIITGVESYGLFAQGLELPAEGLIPIVTLPPDLYDFDRRAHSLTGRRSGRTFRLGDSVRVEVARVDLDARKLDFRLLEHPRRSQRPTPKRHTKTRRRGGR